MNFLIPMKALFAYHWDATDAGQKRPLFPTSKVSKGTAGENNQELKEPLEHIEAQINSIFGDLWKSPASILTGFSTTMNKSSEPVINPVLFILTAQDQNDKMQDLYSQGLKERNERERVKGSVCQLWRRH